LRRYVEADAEDRWSRLALAEGLRRLGRVDEAQRFLQPLPDLDPEVRALRAELVRDQGDLENMERLLAGGPVDHPRLAQLRGQLALKRGDGAAALGHFQAAYVAKPDDPVTLTGLATALKLTGQTKAAEPIRDWIRNYDAMHALVNRLVAAQAASDADLQRRLGSLCEAMGRRSEARAWFRRVIASNPLDAEVQQALFRLGPPAAPPAEAPEPGRTSVERRHRAAAIRPGLAVGRAARRGSAAASIGR